jgi:hypothetical protein
MRGTLLVSVTVLALLVMLNLALHASRTSASDRIVAQSPELGALIGAQDRDEALVIGLASAVLLAGVFAVSILETLKSAGAAHAIEQCLSRIEAGHYATTLRLRRGDNLQNLRQAVNRLGHTLTTRAEEEGAALEALADEAEAADPEMLRALVPAALRRMADDKRRLIG